MTRKHYEAFTAELRSAHPGLTDHDTPEAREEWRACVQAVARVLAADNPRFDGVKFIDACVPAGRFWMHASETGGSHAQR